MDTQLHYVLASGSPRRINMMHEHGIEPEIRPADIDENIPACAGMEDVVRFIAFKKAKAVEPECEPGSIVIAADTIVWKDGEIMGKPADRDDAFRMLSKLRNSSHFVVTGVALLEAGKPHGRVFAEVTEVCFRDYTDEELNAYLDTPEAYDKAGGYAIQGTFSRYISSFDGDIDNVIGFPWKRIELETERFLTR